MKLYNCLKITRTIKLIGWLFGFYDLSTFVDYLKPWVRCLISKKVLLQTIQFTQTVLIQTIQFSISMLFRSI